MSFSLDKPDLHGPFPPTFVIDIHPPVAVGIVLPAVPARVQRPEGTRYRREERRVGEGAARWKVRFGDVLCRVETVVVGGRTKDGVVSQDV